MNMTQGDSQGRQLKAAYLDIYGPISLSTGSIFEYLKEKGLIDRANSIFTCNSSPLLFARATGPISRALAKRINPLGAFAVKRLFNWKIFSDTLVKNLILIDSVIIELVMKYQLLNTALLSKAISQIPPNSEQFSDTDYRIMQAYKCLECFPATAQEAITMKADKSADPRRLFSLMHKTRVMTDPISGKIVKEERNFDFIFTLNFTNRLYYLDIEQIYNYQKTYCFTPVFSDPIYMSFYLLLEGGIDGFFGTAFKGDLITPLATPNFREKFKTDILDKFKKNYDKIESAVAYLDSHLLNKGFHDISSNNPVFKRDMVRIARSANYISSYVPSRFSSTFNYFTPSAVSDYIWSQDGTNLSLIDAFASNVGDGTATRLSLRQFFANYIFKIKDPSSPQENAKISISNTFFKKNILSDGKHNETHLREQPLIPVLIILRYLHDPDVKKEPNLIDLFVLFNFLLHLCIQILAAPKRFSYEMDLKRTSSHSHKALLKIIESTYLSICFIQAVTEQTPSHALPSTSKIPQAGESIASKRVSILYYT